MYGPISNWLLERCRRCRRPHIDVAFIAVEARTSRLSSKCRPSDSPFQSPIVPHLRPFPQSFRLGSLPGIAGVVASHVSTVRDIRSNVRRRTGAGVESPSAGAARRNSISAAELTPSGAQTRRQEHYYSHVGVMADQTASVVTTHARADRPAVGAQMNLSSPLAAPRSCRSDVLRDETGA